VLIIADKIDAHRTRVRKGRGFNTDDIHDKVNYAIRKNWLIVNKEEKNIRFGIVMDESSSVMDFLGIYMTRMSMCHNAAKFLGCQFDIEINGMILNRNIVEGEPSQADDFPII